MFSILAILLSMTVAAEKKDSINDTGQFQYSFSTVEVSPIPGRKPNTEIQATAGFEIKNIGSAPVRIAVIAPWPTLQIEGGIHFNIRPAGITGVSFHNGNRNYCAEASPNFSLLRPNKILTASLIFDSDLKGRTLLSAKWGRISGELMVQSMEDNRCWIEPFTVDRAPVSVIQ